MKNHYLIPALILWCAASCALAQTWSAYNKISIKPLAGTSNHTPNFGGMYDKVYARFTTEHFEAETRYMFNISGSTNRITGIIGKALVRFFPLPQLEFAVGKDLDQALPGSFFTVIDDYATDANYGQDGISVSYNFLNMCATLHMPVSQQYFTDDGFELQGAAALTAQLPAGFATGAMVRYYGNTDFSAALFASWQQGKTLEAGLGYTYNGTSAPPTDTALSSVITSPPANGYMTSLSGSAGTSFILLALVKPLYSFSHSTFGRLYVSPPPDDLKGLKSEL